MSLYHNVRFHRRVLHTVAVIRRLQIFGAIDSGGSKTEVALSSPGALAWDRFQFSANGGVSPARLQGSLIDVASTGARIFRICTGRPLVKWYFAASGPAT